MALLCAFGSAAFGLATDITVAIAGRALIGGSTGTWHEMQHYGHADSRGRSCAAAVFIIILKIASMCFPSRQSLLIGMGVFSGFCGSMLGQAPMASLLEAGVAWRTFVLASVAIPILVTAFFGATWWWLRCTPPQRPRVAVVHVAVLPPQPSNESNPTPNSGNSSTMTSATSPGKPTERPMNAWQRLTVVVCNSNNLALCAVGFFNVAVLNTFASLWGPPFLQAVHGMSRETAAVVSSAVLLGWGLSAPLQGWAGDHVSKPVALACASVSGAVAMTLVVYVPGMSPVLLFVLLYVAGMATPIPLMFATVRFSTITRAETWNEAHLGWLWCVVGCGQQCSSCPGHSSRCCQHLRHAQRRGFAASCTLRAWPPACMWLQVAHQDSPHHWNTRGRSVHFCWLVMTLQSWAQMARKCIPPRRTSWAWECSRSRLLAPLYCRYG